MRTYKFRGIPINKKDRDGFGYEVGKPIDPFVYGDLEIDHNYGGGTKYYISMEVFGSLSYRQRIEVKPETVGQFTGLLDKNGKEIYEGDVVRLDLNNLGFVIAEVNFREGCYCFDTPKDVFTVWNTDVLEMHIEVIGNIHD